MTYGEIARLAGNSKGARQVARILHTLSEKYDLPWHRVVNRKGEIVIKDDETKFIQISRLETEGIFVNCNGCVDLDKYRCTGENTVIREENDFV